MLKKSKKVQKTSKKSKNSKNPKKIRKLQKTQKLSKSKKIEIFYFFYFFWFCRKKTSFWNNFFSLWNLGLTSFSSLVFFDILNLCVNIVCIFWICRKNNYFWNSRTFFTKVAKTQPSRLLLAILSGPKAANKRRCLGWTDLFLLKFLIGRTSKTEFVCKSYGRSNFCFLFLAKKGQNSYFKISVPTRH